MIYLDNAATTFPKPPSVLTTMQESMLRIAANPGRSGHKMSLAAGRAVWATRSLVADFLGVKDAMQLVFTFNCTDALNLAIKGVVRVGDHVITSQLEHNSMLRPLKGLERAGVIELSLLEANDEGLVTEAMVAKAIRPNTRLCALTHASNVLGSVQPIGEIGTLLRKNNILFLVDGAQTAGLVPIDLSTLPVDLFAFPGHKGLMGPQGTGGLYIHENADVSPLREGGTGSASESPYQPELLPDRHESGTLNLPGLCGLYAGVRYVRANMEKIRVHEVALSRYLHEGLSRIPDITCYTKGASGGLGIATFNFGAYPSGYVAEYLDRHDIAVRAGLHCAPEVHKRLGTLEQGAVRASIGAFNTLADIDALLNALEALAAKPQLLGRRDERASVISHIGSI